MGMYLSICTLSDGNVQKVLSDPPLVWKVIAPDDPEAYEEARNEGGDPSPPVQFDLVEGEVADTHLDKAWHGIHYLLTQSAWGGEEPLSFLLCGGNQVGELDVGYGPARVFDSTQVLAIASSLQFIDDAFLRARFNPTELMELEIYPTIWDRDPKEDDTFGYCAEHFAALKSFVEQAAQRKAGLLIYIS